MRIFLLAFSSSLAVHLNISSPIAARAFDGGFLEKFEAVVDFQFLIMIGLGSQRHSGYGSLPQQATQLVKDGVLDEATVVAMQTLVAKS
jgi:hypothetical protein